MQRKRKSVNKQQGNFHNAQFKCNRKEQVVLYSSLIGVIEFLATHELAFRGTVEAFSSMEDGGSGLFLSLLNFTIKEDPRLTEIVKTVPRNGTYASHEIQNELIDVMSSIVKEAIEQEVGDSWFTLKVDGTRDPTGVENVSIVLRSFNEDTEVVTERLLALATSSSGDAQALTQVICSELLDWLRPRF